MPRKRNPAAGDGGAREEPDAANLNGITTSSQATLTLPVDQIRVGERYRKDLGDIASLAASIASNVGLLLQPIVVRWKEGQWWLVVGERRLEAARLAGHKTVPVVAHYDMDDATALRAEFAENTHRKDFTLSEAVSIKRALEPIERAAAKERQGTRSDKHPGKLPTGSTGRAADKAAAATGMARRTLEQAEAVVDAAEAEPEKYGKLKTAMDRTGRVNGVFRQLKVAKQAALIRAEPSPLPGRGPYRVAVVDFSWPENTGRDDVSHIASHPDYPPMTIEEICAFPLASILMEDAVVWMWVTNYELLHGIQLRVLEAHGLKAKRLLTWGKTHFGGGDVLRGQTEHAILAFRGKPPTGAIELFNQSTWLPAPRPKGHSRKPPEFYDLVESLCPAPRYADLFSRYRHNDKWDPHGDQAPTAETEAAE